MESTFSDLCGNGVLLDYIKSLLCILDDRPQTFTEFVSDDRYRRVRHVVDLIDKDSKLSLQIMRKYGAHIKSQYQLRKSVEFVAQQVIDGKIIVVPLGTNHLIIWGGDGIKNKCWFQLCIKKYADTVIK